MLAIMQTKTQMIPIVDVKEWKSYSLEMFSLKSCNRGVISL